MPLTRAIPCFEHGNTEKLLFYSVPQHEHGLFSLFRSHAPSDTTERTETFTRDFEII